MKITVIITAAGKGLRFDQHNPKLLYEFQEKPILIHTIKRITKYIDCNVIITVNKDHLSTYQLLLKQYNINATLVIGGAYRAQSVKNAVDLVNDSEWAFIHDGARPKITQGLIDRLIKEAKTHDCIIPVIPVTDTIKAVKDTFVQETIPRETLFRVQTPQLIKLDLLKKAYTLSNWETATDESLLIERLGFPIKTVEGDLSNIKVTTPDDLKYL